MGGCASVKDKEETKKSTEEPPQEQQAGKAATSSDQPLLEPIAEPDNLVKKKSVLGDGSPRHHETLEKGKLKKRGSDPNIGTHESLDETGASPRAHDPAPCPEVRKREVFEQVFKKYDDDGSGEIDSKEFANILKELGWRHDEEAVTEALKFLDEDGNGTIEIDEFLEWSKIAQQKIYDGETADGLNTNSGRSKAKHRSSIKYDATINELDQQT